VKRDRYQINVDWLLGLYLPGQNAPELPSWTRKRRESLAAWIERMELNQTQVASILGVPRPSINRFLKGRRKPPGPVIRLLQVLKSI